MQATIKCSRSILHSFETHLLYLILLFFAGLPTAQAQMQVKKRAEKPAPRRSPLYVKHLEVADGLNQGSVYAIEQDRRGFMWFGTWNGLNRYDGYNVKTYTTDPFDSTSFQGSPILDIEEDQSGRLWIGTNHRGLSRFDPATGRFKRYPYSREDTTGVTPAIIYDIMIGDSGRIWMTSDGLSSLDPQTGEIRRNLLASDMPEPQPLILLNMYQDRSGTIWIGGHFALYRFDPQTGSGRQYRFDPEVTVTKEFNEQPIRNTAITIVPDPNDRNILWITGIGLIRFNKQTGEHRRFLPTPSDPKDIESNVTFEITTDRRRTNILWITSYLSGLLRFNTRTKQFSRYRHHPGDPNSLASNSLFSIYADRSGMIWTGTHYASGVDRFDPHAGEMRGYGNDFTWSVWQDHKNQLWIGTAKEGLLKMNRNTGKVTHYRHDLDDSSTLSSNTVREIYEDSTGSLWIGTGAGLDKMNRTEGTFTHYQHDSQDSTTITGGEVWTVLEDHEGNFWVGTGQGLSRMNRETGTFTRYTHQPNDSTSLTDGYVSTLYEDHSGQLWVGTAGGLNRLNRATGQFKQYTYDSNDSRGISSGEVTSIHERKSEPGVLWIGLVSGLDRFDTQTEIFTHYNKENGLLDDALCGIMGDENGRLWMSTIRGISRFDPETESFKNYGLASGLHTLECNETSYYHAADGEMFFGGVNGVNAFFPDQLTGNPEPPQVAITGFNLFNQPVEPGPESLLQAPLVQADEIRLQHNQNTIGFEYVGLHFRAPEENQYKYKLEGVDDGWVDAGTRRIARYTNLEPGDYTFKVKAANSDGVWSKQTASIQVTVLPPWWRSWWAYVTYILLIAAVIYAIYRIQRRRLIKKERERARQKELEQEKEHARELEEAYEELETAHKELETAHENLKAAQEQLVQQEKLASLGQLTAGIAHEIKNPLNFVNNFSELSVELVEEAREELLAVSGPSSEEATEKSPFEGGGSEPSGEESGDVQAVQEALHILDNVETNLKKINEHGDRADGIVKSMLQHSRGGDGEREPTDLNALVEEYVDLAYHGMRASEHPINLEIQKDLDEAVGDVPLVAEDFSRVIINLCNNAFDAMREKADAKRETPDGYLPKLTVRTRQEEDQIVIEVEDNGPGIPEDVKDQILQPFYTTKEGAEGTGLGLSITQDIVKAHGGEIQVESEPNDYTRFTISLNINSDSLS